MARHASCRSMLRRGGCVSSLFALAIIAAAQAGEQGDINGDEGEQLLLDLYQRDTKTPKSRQDVYYNDGVRENNFRAAIQDRDEQRALEPRFYSLPRPQDENDILVAAFQEGLEKMRAGDSTDFDRTLFTVVAHQFCTYDERLGEVFRELICHGDVMAHCPHAEDISQLLQALGQVHTEPSVRFMTQARDPAFWCAMPSLAYLTGKYREKRAKDLCVAAAYGMCRLPLETGLPLVEEVYSSMPEDDWRRTRILFEIDRLWQQKLGRFQEREDEVRSGTGTVKDRNRYPEWLYGPGGQKIEWPFGPPPPNYENREIPLLGPPPG